MRAALVLPALLTCLARRAAHCFTPDRIGRRAISLTPLDRTNQLSAPVLRIPNSPFARSAHGGEAPPRKRSAPRAGLIAVPAAGLIPGWPAGATMPAVDAT